MKQWQAMVFPLFLTSLVYSGSILLKAFLLIDELKELNARGEGVIQHLNQQLCGWIYATVSNVIAWRNYVVAPLTEELVFRACIVPLLLCGGFSTYTTMFLGPIFFSLAHLNHLMEICSQGDWAISKALTIVGIQLCYTVLFGSFASFLFIRTGHLMSPIAAHILCNFMGLPLPYSGRNGLVTVAFLVGVVSFIYLAFPLTRPELYNDNPIDTCGCWHVYCSQFLPTSGFH
uniref:intramembrane prenyl-peptidase Rce1 n=1 Tax=Kalanchoe fedtschenkoi TaxID=63787 RepID=A0A7N0SZ03_KALFE